MTTTTQERQTLMHTSTTRPAPAPRAATAVLRPGTLTSPAGMQALGLARFSDDPGAQGAAGGEQAPAGSGEGESGQTGTGTGEQQQASQQAPAGDPADWKMEDLPEKAQSYIRSLRDEAKRDRTTQQENAAAKARDDQLTAIAKTFNLSDDEKNGLAEQLSQHFATVSGERDEARAELSTLRAEKTIREAAEHVAIDAKAALDLKATDKALEGIDLTDTKAVQDALLKVAEQHPHIKAASTVGRTGGDHHNGEATRAKPKDLTAAIAAEYS